MSNLVEDYGMSARASNVLKALGAKTLDDVRRIGPKALERRDHCGPKTVKEIGEVLFGGWDTDAAKKGTQVDSRALRDQRLDILISVFREIADPAICKPHTLNALARHTLFLIELETKIDLTGVVP